MKLFVSFYIYSLTFQDIYTSFIVTRFKRIQMNYIIRNVIVRVVYDKFLACGLSLFHFTNCINFDTHF